MTFTCDVTLKMGSKSQHIPYSKALFMQSIYAMKKRIFAWFDMTFKGRNICPSQGFYI